MTRLVPLATCENRACRATYKRKFFPDERSLDHICPDCRAIAEGDLKQCELCREYFTRKEFKTARFYFMNHRKKENIKFPQIMEFCAKWQLCKKCHTAVDELPDEWILNIDGVHAKTLSRKTKKGVILHWRVTDGFTILHQNPTYPTCGKIMIQDGWNGPRNPARMIGFQDYSKHATKYCHCTHTNPYLDVDGGPNIVDDL